MAGTRYALLCAVLAALGGNAYSQGAASFPVKPVRIVLPYPPGGGTDTIGRPLAHRLSENLKQQFLIDNRGGANGNIGMEVVAKSPPDDA
jgi:tripartite-type tricarboxylate transporter receptor subunit TctC